MAEVKPYPVTVTGELSDPPGQWQWLFKWLLVIPHSIVLYFLGIAAGVVTIIAFFAILFTGRYPEGLFRFAVGTIRWSARVNAYMWLLRDEYPPFGLAP